MVLTQVKKFQVRFLDSLTSSDSQALLSFVFNYSVVLIILTINYLLRIVIVRFSHFERRKSHTEFLSSQIRKVFVFLFANTGLIVFFTIRQLTSFTDNFEALFNEKGLVYEIQLVMAVSLVSPLLWSLVHPFHLIRTLRYRLVRRLLRSSDRSNRLIQSEVNRIYEKNHFDFAFKYYQILKTMCIALFYQLLVPFGLLMGLLELGFYLVSDRFSLARRCLKPREYNFVLTLSVLSNFDFCLIFLPLGYIVTIKYFFGQEPSFLLYLCLGLTLFEALIINLHLLFACCRRCDQFATESVDFETVGFRFKTYDQVNPATSDLFFSRLQTRLNFSGGQQPLPVFPQLRKSLVLYSQEQLPNQSNAPGNAGKKADYRTKRMSRFKKPQEAPTQNNQLLSMVRMITTQRKAAKKNMVHLQDGADVLDLLFEEEKSKSGLLSFESMLESLKVDNSMSNKYLDVLLASHKLDSFADFARELGHDANNTSIDGVKAKRGAHAVEGPGGRTDRTGPGESISIIYERESELFENRSFDLAVSGVKKLILRKNWKIRKSQ